MRVLVTGGAGYIGSRLVPLLRRGGHDVTVLDCATALDGAGIRVVSGDVRDESAVRVAMGGVEAVVHLAAISGYPACESDPDRAWSVNVEGTRTVCREARDRVVVLASTGSVYGAIPGGLCTEETPPRPASEYGRTKLAAEEIVRGQAHGTVLRLATCYGLSPRMRLDLLINHFADVLLRGVKLEVYEPEARRTFLHVADAARAMLHAVEHVVEHGGVGPSLTVNVGDEAQNLTKRQAAELVRARIPGATVSYDAHGRDPDSRDYAVSYALVRSLGYRALVGIEQGIDELVAGLGSVTEVHREG